MTGFGRCISLILLLAALGTGEETAQATEVTLDLGAAAPSGDARLGYSRPRSFPLERTVPRFLFEVPKFTAKDPLFFRLSLGETEGVPFYGALDRSQGGLYHDRLWIDRNRDLDLTNDGDPVEARVRTLWSTDGKLVEFLGLRLELPYRVDGRQTREPYACVVYYVLDGKGGPQVPARVLMERDGWRQGELKLDGKAYTVALVDDDSDGQFSTGDSWVVRPADRPLAELLDRDAVRTMLFPAWTADQQWTVSVKSVESSGRRAVLRVAPAKESERDYFLRIARQRQSPEERQLNIDPLRPKADDNEKIDWLTGKDAEYALELAAKPRIRKPVLLDFSSRTCRWCAAMNRYTFRDREVVALSKRFVCTRIEFAEGQGDSAKYAVSGTPTYVILNLDGSEIARHEGFSRPAEFAAWLKSALR